VAGGYIVQWFGFSAGFLSLAAAAVCGLVFFFTLMPETGRRAPG
jgi:predicted MFS family arabinose efflux permease